MNRSIAALLAVFIATIASPVRADVTPKDVKKATTESAEAKPKKKKSRLFGDNALSKDRSLPADSKVQTTADDKPAGAGKPKDPPYKNLGSELRKDRSK